MKISLRDVYSDIKNTISPQTEDAAFEAKELLQAVFGVSRQDILLGRETEVESKQLDRLCELARRRASGEPLQYLLGEWDFYGRTFSVGPGVLIPRADTEPLVEKTLDFLKGKPNPRVLDLCTGSGCIAVTIGAERPDAEVWAVEKSPEAWDFFCHNNEKYGGRVHGVLADALADIPILPVEFDLIISNPPYLTAEEMADLQPEVQKEPAMALDGGEDGLSFYRQLTSRYRGFLKPGGMMAYEIGMGQEHAVCEIFLQNRLDSVCQTKDLHGIIRVVTAENKLSQSDAENQSTEVDNLWPKRK